MKIVAWLLVLLVTPAFAATEAQEAALREIETFTAVQQKTDPHYAKVEAQLMPQVDDLIKRLPAPQWAPTIKRMYFGLSEKAASDERSQIRDAEQGLVGNPARSAADRYIDRLEALERDLHAGKLGPREHAIHALEAARAIYPQDRALIALREAKVPIATDYELGRISRVEYDQRWATARANYEQAATSRDRTMADPAPLVLPAASAAPSLGDRIRRAPAVNCTTTPSPLGASTTCR